MDLGAITEIRLLELAAKEAGVHEELLTNQSLKDKLNNSHHIRRTWNPIHSSEEAFKLLVDCNVHLTVFVDNSAKATYLDVSITVSPANTDIDKYSPARKAIVCVLAIKAHKRSKTET